MCRSLRGLVADALLAVLLASCSSEAATTHPSPAPVPYVQTVTAARGTLQPSLQIAGVIAPYRQVGIAADLSEPITDVYVQEGDRVHAGAPLARLLTDDLEAQLASSERLYAEDVAHYDQTSYQTTAVNAQDLSAVNAARASLHQAQVNLSGALTDLQRYQSLYSQGYLPAQTVDQQRTTVASDQAAVNSAEAGLSQALANLRADGSGQNAGVERAQLQAARQADEAAAASVEQLRREIARALIVAPVDGTVDAVNANPGEYPSGRQLFTIEQLNEVYAVLPASTAQVVQIHQGAAASVVPAGSTQRMRGTVAAVLDEVQPGTTNFTVKVLIQNPLGLLHGGMPVTGTVDLPPVSGIEIPVGAFVDDTHGSVYIVSNDVVQTRTVHEVQDDGNNAIVSGIAAGTRVVANVESENVGNGDKVSLTPPPSPSPGPSTEPTP